MDNPSAYNTLAATTSGGIGDGDASEGVDNGMSTGDFLPSLVHTLRSPFVALSAALASVPPTHTKQLPIEALKTLNLCHGRIEQ